MCACGNANKKDGMKEEKIRWKLEGPMATVCRFEPSATLVPYVIFPQNWIAN